MPHGEFEIEPSQVPQGSRLHRGRRAGCRAGLRASGAVRPSAILLTNAPGGEQALQRLEQLQPALTAARRLEGANLREDVRHQRQLGGTVVDAHERVQPDIQLRGDRPQVLRLGLPVAAIRREVGDGERHLELVEDRNHVGGVVLRTECQQCAFLLELEQELLEHVERKPQPFGPVRDALWPVFADHPVPERAVEVNNQSLLSLPWRIHQLHRPPRRAFALLHGQRTAGTEPVPHVQGSHW